MEQFLHLAETEVSAAVVVINILLVLALELVVAWAYRKTHRTLSYSQSFLTTLILMGIIANIIMMVVAENIIGAFALLGAFSLIRFRTIVKEPRDIAFVFLVLAIGVAVGTNNYTVAIIGTALITLIVFGLHYVNFGSGAYGGHILIITARPPFTPDTSASWKKYGGLMHLLQIKSLSPQLHEYTFGIKISDASQISKLVDALTSTDGVEHTEVLSGKDVIEY